MVCGTFHRVESPVVFISALFERGILISNGEVILTPIAKSLVS
jgi:hypothetical protein